jgi:hypothetical protein
MFGYDRAEDPEWRDFHGYKSVEEGRRAIEAARFKEYAEKSIVSVDIPPELRLGRMTDEEVDRMFSKK